MISKMALVLPVIMVLILGTCKDNQTTPLQDLNFDFPLTVGSRWKYARYDSLADQTDTVEVTIARTVTLPDGRPATVWHYLYPTKMESLYVVRIADTVQFVEYVDGIHVGFKIIFPLEIGQRWLGTLCDSLIVQAREDLIVPAGSFDNVTRIAAYSYCPNDLSHWLYWIKPGIGIIKIFQFVFITVSIEPDKKETWELLSYTIPNT